MAAPRFKIIVCRGPRCESRGSRDLANCFEQELGRVAAAGTPVTVEMAWQSCFGRCEIGPNVLVREITEPERPRGFATLPGPRGITALYNRVTPDRVGRIIASHLIGKRIVRDYLEKIPVLAAHQPELSSSNATAGIAEIAVSGTELDPVTTSPPAASPLRSAYNTAATTPELDADSLADGDDAVTSRSDRLGDC